MVQAVLVTLLSTSCMDCPLGGNLGSGAGLWGCVVHWYKWYVSSVRAWPSVAFQATPGDTILPTTHSASVAFQASEAATPAKALPSATEAPKSIVARCFSMRIAPLARLCKRNNLLPGMKQAPDARPRIPHRGECKWKFKTMGKPQTNSAGFRMHMHVCKQQNRTNANQKRYHRGPLCRLASRTM